MEMPKKLKKERKQDEKCDPNKSRRNLVLKMGCTSKLNNVWEKERREREREWEHKIWKYKNKKYKETLIIINND